MSWKPTEKKQLSSLLTTHILSHTVNFATRVQNSSGTATDNIPVINSRLDTSSTSPIISSLSDHNAQIFTITKIYATINKFSLKQTTRLVNSEMIMNFQTPL